MGLIDREMMKGGAPAEDELEQDPAGTPYAAGEQPPTVEGEEAATPDAAEAQGTKTAETDEKLPAEDGPVADESEQGAYDKVVLAGLKLLHDPKAAPAYVKMLKQRADEPAEALADVTMQVMEHIEKQSKGTVPLGVILPAATELLLECAEIAKATGAFEAEKQQLAHAMQLIILATGNKYGIDEGELQGLMQQAAAQQGKATQAPPGLDAAPPPPDEEQDMEAA